MTPVIKNVALAGGSGTLGKHILAALLEFGFTVTVLTRNSSSSKFPCGPIIKEVDYDSLESLTEAFRGQDAVINATSTTNVEGSKLLVDAAAAAGVYRFIPPDFGMDPKNPNVAALPVYGLKAATYKHLQEKAAQNPRFTYTVVSNGPFLDWGIRSCFMGLDVKNRKISLFDGGENVLPWTTLAAVGKATAAVLKHHEQTANRPVYIQSICMSQMQLARQAKQALGGDWDTERLDVTAAFQDCLESVKKGIYAPEVMYPQLKFATANKDYSAPWKTLDNELLGVEEMTDDDLKALIIILAAE